MWLTETHSDTSSSASLAASQCLEIVASNSSFLVLYLYLLGIAFQPIFNSILVLSFLGLLTEYACIILQSHLLRIVSLQIISLNDVISKAVVVKKHLSRWAQAHLKYAVLSLEFKEFYGIHWVPLIRNLMPSFSKHFNI